MSKRTPNQDKALAWFMETNHLKPQLSTRPTYFFVNTKGKVETHNIINITASWERWRKENKKEKRLS